MTVRLTSVSDAVARVELDLGDRPMDPDLLPVAVGRIVLTATSVDGVRGVLLRSGGRPWRRRCPAGGGGRSRDRVRRQLPRRDA